MKKENMKYDKFAIWSFILMIFGILLMASSFPAFWLGPHGLGILVFITSMIVFFASIILGIIGIIKINKYKEKGLIYSVLGIVISSFLFLTGLLLLYTINLLINRVLN